MSPSKRRAAASHVAVPAAEQSQAAAPPASTLKPQIEAALDRLLPAPEAQPEALHRAMRYAVFANGKRLRPQFLIQVARACSTHGEGDDLTMRAACAIELVHIASLVHDDLPCFDNAALRRGRPTVHVLFGEARALLVGDALLARSFELLTSVPASGATRALRIAQLLAQAAGSTSGLVAGQGLEHDLPTDRTHLEGADSYHAMKTGALFSMAAEAGAVAAGSRKASAWARIGWLVGRGYQVAHALQSLPVPSALGADPLPSPHAPRIAPLHPAVALRRELGQLSATLHEQIQALAVTPQPLLTFLDGLCGPLLQPTTPTSTDAVSGSTPTAAAPRSAQTAVD